MAKKLENKGRSTAPRTTEKSGFSRKIDNAKAGVRNGLSSLGRSTVGFIVRCITVLALAWTIFGAGFLLCSTSWATNTIGNAFAGWNESTLPAEDMAAIAEEVRQFSMGEADQEALESTVLEHLSYSYPEVAKVIEQGDLSPILGSNTTALATAAEHDQASKGEGSAAETEEALDRIAGIEPDAAGDDANTEAIMPTDEGATTGEYTHSTDGDADSSGTDDEADANSSDTVTEALTTDSSLAENLGLPTGSGNSYVSLNDLEMRYSLPEDAINHLADCIPVFITGRGSIVFATIIALAGLIFLGITRGRRAVGLSLAIGGALPVILLLGVGVWALFDFDSLFTYVHGLFFADGTWTFDAQSLLIKLFPEPFWTAMAFLWAAASIALGVIIATVGRFVFKRG